MTRHILFSFILISSILLLNACDSTKSQAPCSKEDFKAIFPENLQGIEEYQLEITDQSATESFTLTKAFPVKINVEIIQVGCHDLTQELRFEVMDKIPPQLPAQECTQIVMGIFNYFANLDPQLLTFGAFVQVMGSKLQNFEYNSPIPLQDGFSMQIDKMHNAESTLISVTIRQQKEE